MAYDLTGQQRFVVRGGGGLFFDRPSGNSVFAQVLNPPTLAERHRPLRAAADARERRPHHQTPPALNVFEYDSDLPVVDSVEQRRADGAAVGHGARRLVRRPAPVRHPPEHGHQPGRFRHGVPAGEPGSDAGAEHDAGRHRRRHRPDAGVPGIQLDHADVGLAGADLPLAAAVAPAPASGTGCRSGSTTPSASTIARPRRRGCSTPPTGRCRSGRIRPKPIACSATTTPRRTSSRRTSCGICRTCAARRRLLRTVGADRQRLAAGGHLDRGHRQRVRHRLQLQQRRRQREPDRLARLRRPDPDRRRHRQRLQRRRLPPVQRRGVPGTAAGLGRPRVRATTT